MKLVRPDKSDQIDIDVTDVVSVTVMATEIDVAIEVNVAIEVDTVELHDAEIEYRFIL